jgi:hypothetical protein
MSGKRWLTLGSLRFALAGLGLVLLTACDPPRDLTKPNATGDASAASEDTAAQADPVPEKVSKLPASGDVVLAGGWTKGNKSTASAEFYDPMTKKFTKTGSMAASTGALTGALLNSGQILVAGGFGGKSKFTRKTVSQSVNGTEINNLQTYDPTTGKFTAANAALLTPRFGATATTLASGKVLIAGGVDSSGNPLNTAEVFDPSTGVTTATLNAMNAARAFQTATLLGDGTVLVAGGASDSTGDLTSTADVYDPTSNMFSATTGTMTEPRGAHAAVVLTSGPLSGQVLITGGVTGSSVGLFPQSAVEAYDPAAKTFSTVGSIMNDPRAFHTATVLENGQVLIVGGFSNFDSTINTASGSLLSLFGSNLSSAEIYDPVANTFTCIGGIGGSGGNTCSASMKMGRGGHTASLIASGSLAGEVLIAGGLGAKKPNSKATELKEAELFNPTSNTFTKTGNLKTARGLQVAIVLP